MAAWRSPGRDDDARDGARDNAGHDGYYSLADAPGDGWLVDDDDDIGACPDPSPWPHAPAPPAGRRQRWRLVARILAALLLLAIALVAWLALTAPLSKSLQPIVPPQLTLLAADGTPIARKGAIVEAPVAVADLPAHVTNAFLAIEDRRFYSHWGVDPRGIARAGFANVFGGDRQGGSTITQQLAKFTFLSSEQTLGRKGREVLIAFWLEAWLTKDEILERYLSNAYFGDNTYGLRAAAMHYFHRRPERLTPSQAALLAGLLKAPTRLAPTRNPELAEARMALVVAAMVEAGAITPAEARGYRMPRLDVRRSRDVPTGSYFADWALPEARAQGGAGYERQAIRTTLDSRLQAAARAAIARAALEGAQVALVAMRRNGEVVALVGGRDYARSAFNRATQARRQPGSTFKLFVYFAALQDGMTPQTPIANTAFTQGGYRPKNAAGRYSHTLTLEEAFARSSNVAAVRVMREVGSDKVIRVARRLGVTAPLPEGDPSVALGTASMSLIELTAAYAGVAGNAYPVQPTAFARGEAGWFDRIVGAKHAMRAATHRDIERLLRAAINRGTGRAAQLTVPNYGKTGTSQDNRDALFVGYAGDLVVGVWVGNDDNSPLKGVSGGTVPARIWRDFMVRALGPAAAPARREAAPVQQQLEEAMEGMLPDGLPTGLPSGLPTDLPLGLPTDLPLGDRARLRVRQGEDAGVTVTTDLGGAPVEVEVGRGGVRVRSGRLPSPAPSEAPD